MTSPTLQPLVLVPGLLCDALLWSPQVQGLADVADCWVADATRQDTVDGMARHLLEQCPFERFALAGLSMGGYVAQRVCHLAPERVQRLALLDTNAVADSEAATAQRHDLMRLAPVEGMQAVAELLLPRLVWPQARDHDRLAALVRTMARNVGPKAFIRQENAIIGRPDQREALASITCPTLVACGAQDVLTPPAVHEEMSRRVPGAQLVVFADSGHLSTLEQPEAVNDALRAWLVH
ncbi:alpha/beta fold hydrolase [Variovorax dokdonensis]|uniref:Alpha/beta fold hydrolase n=1 Tax=Variovorax dokdonensis TaxID=344883 RepID=A0ABT7N5U5_9BURK|nr:alpha/beta fold hydrolase [Variovorax dokdonensis]MDM0043293.1 alpha/beta fold hydrolase [Variovorax dokdonensis]